MYPFSLARLLLISLIILSLSNCNKATLEPLGPDDTVLAFGDSLTVGVGAKRDSSYPPQLSKLIQRRVISAGISGETTSEGIKRFATLLDTHQPRLVILLEGGNDILRGLNLTLTQNNLEQMVIAAQSREIDVILIGVPEKKLFSNSAPLFESIAAKYGLVYDGKIIAQLLRDPAMKSDPIHLNAKGYRKLAERLAELMRAHGALID